MGSVKLGLKMAAGANKGLRMIENGPKANGVVKPAEEAIEARIQRGASAAKGSGAKFHEDALKISRRNSLDFQKRAPGGTDVTWEGEFSKVDSDKRQVFGWASVVEIGGKPVVDLQGDYMAPDEIEKAAYHYVINSRVGGDMHRREGVSKGAFHASDLIESFMVTPEKIEKMGLPEDTPIGWWVGFQVNDDNTWNQIKIGKRAGFSIHGAGRRVSKSYDDVVKRATKNEARMAGAVGSLVGGPVGSGVAGAAVAPKGRRLRGAAYGAGGHLAGSIPGTLIGGPVVGAVAGIPGGAYGAQKASELKKPRAVRKSYDEVAKLSQVNHARVGGALGAALLPGGLGSGMVGAGVAPKGRKVAGAVRGIGGELGGAIGGAAAGAAAGHKLGPEGTVAGAVTGGVIGSMGGAAYGAGKAAQLKPRKVQKGFHPGEKDVQEFTGSKSDDNGLIDGDGPKGLAHGIRGAKVNRKRKSHEK